MLEPYEIHLETNAPEAALISLLQDLPHLNSLRLVSFIVDQYADATLAVIKPHVARSLKELFIDYRCGSLNAIGFSRFDRFVSELIETCQLLERLTMPCYGLESLVAISKHSSMRFANFPVTESVAEEMLDGLLLDDKVTWPSSLVIAIIRSHSGHYEFDKRKSRHWSKQRR
eukprot:scaffold769_cov178-Ochromonas_danica.AAC.5